MRVSTTLVEQRQGFNFWKIVEHMYRIPFWDTCRQKSRVCTCTCMFTLCYTNNKPLHDSCQHYTGFLKTQSPTEGGVELDNKDSLPKAVESLFNKLYGKHMKYCMYKLYCTVNSIILLFAATFYQVSTSMMTRLGYHTQKQRSMAWRLMDCLLAVHLNIHHHMESQLSKVFSRIERIWNSMVRKRDNNICTCTRNVRVHACTMYVCMYIHDDCVCTSTL